MLQLKTDSRQVARPSGAAASGAREAVGGRSLAAPVLGSAGGKLGSAASGDPFDSAWDGNVFHQSLPTWFMKIFDEMDSK